MEELEIAQNIRKQAYEMRMKMLQLQTEFDNKTLEFKKLNREYKQFCKQNNLTILK